MVFSTIVKVPVPDAVSVLEHALPVPPLPVAFTVKLVCAGGVEFVVLIVRVEL